VTNHHLPSLSAAGSKLPEFRLEKGEKAQPQIFAAIDSWRKDSTFAPTDGMHSDFQNLVVPLL
jgi:hypothetical protein